MKRFIAFALCAVLLLAGCTSAPKETEPQPTQPQVELTPLTDGKTLKLLAVGNSFSMDTTEYLYDILKAEGYTDVIIGRLHIGSCTLARHFGCATRDLKDYEYHKNTDGKWVQYAAYSLHDALVDEDWDIITFQQASGDSGKADTYDVLPQLTDYVKENMTNPDAKFVWHMTWAYQADSDHSAFVKYANKQDVMYQEIVKATQAKIVPNESMVAIIPAGTTIQNARTSFLGDTLTRDGYHLSIIGRVIASYAWYAILTGKTLDQVNLEKAGGFDMYPELKTVIIESVNNSLAKPFEVTTSVNTTIPDWYA